MIKRYRCAVRKIEPWAGSLGRNPNIKFMPKHVFEMGKLPK
jgi:hypothetical protein